MAVSIQHGPMAGLRWDIRSGPTRYWRGTYEPEMQRRLLSLTNAGDRVFDCGAHAGFFTLLLAHHGRAVTAFEPGTIPGRLLRRHLSINGLTQRVVVCDRAIADSTGAVPFGGVSDWAHSTEGITRQSKVYVEAVTLDEWCRTNPFPSLIKMDVEGGEIAGLRGAQHVLAEVHPTLVVSLHGPHAEAACRTLIPASYQVELCDDVLIAQ